APAAAVTIRAATARGATMCRSYRWHYQPCNRTGSGILGGRRQALLDECRHIVQLLRAQARAERGHLIAARPQYGGNTIHSKCGGDRLPATLASLAVIPVAVDTCGAVDLFPIDHVGRARRRGSTGTRARRGGLKGRQRLDRAFESEEPDAVALLRAQYSSAGIHRQQLLALVHERRDAGIHRRLRLELPKPRTVRGIQRGDTPVIAPQEHETSTRHE